MFNLLWNTLKSQLFQTLITFFETHSRLVTHGNSWSSINASVSCFNALVIRYIPFVFEVLSCHGVILTLLKPAFLNITTTKVYMSDIRTLCYVFCGCYELHLTFIKTVNFFCSMTGGRVLMVLVHEKYMVCLFRETGSELCWYMYL